MPLPYMLAGGSVIGTDHRRASRNNQDAFTLLQEDHAIVAVVCDGCSDGSHHEVGALIGCRLIARALMNHVSWYPNLMYPSCWERARESVLARLGDLAYGMGGNLKETIYNYFLFTCLGCVITQTKTVFFAVGDGVFLINDDVLTLGPYENNMPPYLGYGITGDAFSEEPELLQLRRIHQIPTYDLQRFFIGTDGVIDLIGTDGEHDVLEQFFAPNVFTNPQTITRKLQVLNREKTLVDPQTGVFLGHETGKLRDDTTCIAGIQRIGGKEE